MKLLPIYENLTEDNQQKVKLPAGVITQLKKVIQQHSTDSKKRAGYTEIVTYVGTGEMSFSQMAKIKSFFENYQPSDLKQKEKKPFYDPLRAFVLSQLQHEKNRADQSQKNRTATDHPSKKKGIAGRNVDRMNSVNTTSIEPALIKSYPLREEISRIKQLMK